MELFDGVMNGLRIALSLNNFAYCFAGVFLGTIVGVLPGLGPVATISLLLSLTYRMEMSSAIIMLAGIFYGAMYGGSITSILINVPGEAASVVTCIDGYQMAKKGRAGVALGISAFGSFIAGTIGTIGLMIMAPVLSDVALKIGSTEYSWLMILGVTLVTYLSGGSKIKALIMAALGLVLGCVGMDPVSAQPRFTFGIRSLLGGLDIPIVAMGLFGISEVLFGAAEKDKSKEYLSTSTRLRQLLPNGSDWSRSIGPIARGSVIGFLLGILPGGGAVLSSFSSYALEKRRSKTPEEFGHGAIEGVAGPEAANNAAVAGSFVPLLTLGIPCNATVALILAAFMIHGVAPGPLLLQNRPDIFWAIVVSMYVGNAILLILNVPLIGLFVKLLRVPGSIMRPLIIVLCFVGAFTTNNDPRDVIVVAVLGVAGYGLRRLGFDLAPLVLAFVVGPILERAFRTSLVISGGDPTIFFSRTASQILALFTIGFVLSPLVWELARGRRKVSEG